MATAGIKNIKIEIDGDTSKLGKALDGITKHSKNIDDELRQVNRLLKLDPSNTVLLEQKQKLLAEQISTTKEKLQTLTTAQEQAKQQLTEGSIGEDEYRALERQIIDTTNALDKYEQQMRDLESSSAAAADDIEKASGAADDLDNSLSDTAEDAQQASDGIQGFGEAAKTASGKIKNISTAAAGAAAAAVALTESTREYREDIAKLSTNAQLAGIGIDDAKNALRDFVAITGESDSSVEALSNLLESGFTQSQLQTAVENLSGAVIKFPDTLKIESLSDSIEETLATGAATGQIAEMFERLGYNMDEFNAGLQEAKANGTETNFMMQQLASTGLAEVNEAYRENNESLIEGANATFDLNDRTAQLANEMEPLVTTMKSLAVDALGGVVSILSGLDENTLKFIGTLVLLVAGLAPVLSVIGNISIGINAIIPVMSSVMAFCTGTAGPAIATFIGGIISTIGLVPIAIGAVIAIVVYLWNTSEEFRVAVGQIWADITSSFQLFDEFMQNIFQVDWTESFGAFGEILNSFFANVENIYNAMKSIFSGLIDFIKGIFTGDWQLAWSGVVSIFDGIFAGIEAIAKAPLNGIIGLVNALINGINFMIGKVNSISIDIPDWLGGGHIGFSLGYLSKIPYLAHGGVLSDGDAIFAENGPEYLHMEGGRAIVTPLSSTSRMSNVDQDKPIVINLNLKTELEGKQVGYTLAKYVTTEQGFNARKVFSK